MQRRRRFKQTESLKDRLASFADEALDQASRLPAGPERDAFLKKARQANTASDIDEWAHAPGLRTPE